MKTEYTRRRNVNRAYLKLDVWQRGMDLFKLALQMAGQTRDWKLRMQFVDAVQSVSTNIAEGYGRRSLPEYLQFLYIAKGSLAESLTRAIGLGEAVLISKDHFEAFDQLHYEVENKLLHLISALESRSQTGGWQTTLPATHQSADGSSTSFSRSADHPAEKLANSLMQQDSHATQSRQPLRTIQQSINPSIQPSR